MARTYKTVAQIQARPVPLALEPMYDTMVRFQAALRIRELTDEEGKILKDCIRQCLPFLRSYRTRKRRKAITKKRAAEICANPIPKVPRAKVISQTEMADLRTDPNPWLSGNI